MFFRRYSACAMILPTMALMLALPACDDDPVAPEPTTGSIRVWINPSGTPIPWTLVGPEEYEASGAGDSLLADLAPGDYALTWGSLEGWYGDDDVRAGTLDVGETLVLSGSFVDHLQFANTKGKLLENYQTAYELLSEGDLMDCLAADYRFLLQANTIDAFPELGSELDRDETETIHANMLGGAAGRDPVGYLTPPIAWIVFQEPLQLTAWRTIPEDDEDFPGTEAALFDVKFEFIQEAGLRWLVEGQIEIYVRLEDQYRIVGILDHTLDAKGVKAYEQYSFGGLQALFR